jgi:hypothetical protein
VGLVGGRRCDFVAFRRRGDFGRLGLGDQAGRLAPTKVGFIGLRPFRGRPQPVDAWVPSGGQPG